MISNDFLGQNNVTWFFGVVEDINDPKELGRCRVRCFGIHPEDKTKVPTEELPWAHPVQPITSAAASGIGQSPTGILPGTHVIGIFRDGAASQQPIILGTIGGMNVNVPNTNKGFTDPSGSIPHYNYIGEPDTNKLARGISDETIVAIKQNQAFQNVNHPTPESNKTDHGWDEPVTPYDSRYPYNHVRKTESGHIQEFDDTPGSERINTYHRSGTFDEIHPDGTKVVKVVSDDYHLVAGKEFVHIVGNTNVMIGPLNGQATENAGNITLYVVGNADVEVKGNINATCKEHATIKSEKSVNVDAKGGVHIVSQNGLAITDGEHFKMFTKDGDTILRTGNDFKIKADGDIIIQGKNIDLNP